MRKFGIGGFRPFVSLTLCLVVFFFGCRSFLTSYETRQQRLSTRIEQFHLAVFQKDLEAVWNLSASSVRLDNPHEKYVATLEGFFHDATVSYHSPKILIVRDTYAINSQKYVLNVKGETFLGCEKTVWKWENEDWYFTNANIRCDYDFEEKYLKRSIR